MFVKFNSYFKKAMKHEEFSFFQAKLIEFNPLKATDVQVPGGAVFVVANCLVSFICTIHSISFIYIFNIVIVGLMWLAFF